MNKSLKIVLTPVRNESWILPAFLKATSEWADYIIVADQMSTDGSAEICRNYKNVILVENSKPEFNEPERQSMLIDEARRLSAGRDCILFAFDADEILPAHWQETADGQRILNSSPGDVFCLQWAQLSPDRKHYAELLSGGEPVFFPWVFHDDGVTPHCRYVRGIHSMRIPYPEREDTVYKIKDFHVLHGAYLIPERVASKNRFYQLVAKQLDGEPYVKLAREYALHRTGGSNLEYPFVLDAADIDFPFNFWEYVDAGIESIWFDDYLAAELAHDLRSFRKLDIWDNSFIEKTGISDPRTALDKAVHAYIHRTQGISASLPVKIIDHLLYALYG